MVLKKYRYVFLLLLVLFLTAVTTAFFRTYKANIAPQVHKQNEPINDIPPLFPKVSWSVFHPDEKYLAQGHGKYSLYIQGDAYGSVPIQGQEWYSSNTQLSRQQLDALLEEFRDYYGKKLQGGWDTSIKIQGYDVAPLFANGPGGSIYGHIALKNNSIREILLQEVSPIEDFGGKATCPCRLGLYVFVSEPLQVEQLLKAIENIKE